MLRQPPQRHASLVWFPVELTVGDALEEAPGDAHFAIEFREERLCD
jgi:hypothetical protein